MDRYTLRFFKQIFFGKRLKDFVNYSKNYKHNSMVWDWDPYVAFS